MDASGFASGIFLSMYIINSGICWHYYVANLKPICWFFWYSNWTSATFIYSIYIIYELPLDAIIYKDSSVYVYIPDQCFLTVLFLIIFTDLLTLQCANQAFLKPHCALFRFYSMNIPALFPYVSRREMHLYKNHSFFSVLST